MTTLLPERGDDYTNPGLVQVQRNSKDSWDFPKVDGSIFYQLLNSQSWSVIPNRFVGIKNNLRNIEFLNNTINQKPYTEDEFINRVARPLQKTLFRYANKALNQNSLSGVLEPQEFIAIVNKINTYVIDPEISEQLQRNPYYHKFLDSQSRFPSPWEMRFVLMCEEVMPRDIDVEKFANAADIFLYYVANDQSFWSQSSNSESRESIALCADSFVDISLDGLKERTGKITSKMIEDLGGELRSSAIDLALTFSGVSLPLDNSKRRESIRSQFIKGFLNFHSEEDDDGLRSFRTTGIDPRVAHLNKTAAVLTANYPEGPIEYPEISALDVANAFQIFSALMEKDCLVNSSYDCRNEKFTPLKAFWEDYLYNPVCNEDYPQFARTDREREEIKKSTIIQCPELNRFMELFDRMGGAPETILNNINQQMEGQSDAKKKQIFISFVKDYEELMASLKRAVNNFGTKPYNFKFTCDAPSLIFSDYQERIFFYGFSGLLRFIDQMDQHFNHDVFDYLAIKHSLPSSVHILMGYRGEISPAKFLAYNLDSNIKDYRKNKDGDIIEESDYHLSTLGKFAPLVHKDKLAGDSLRDLEEILREIFLVQFENNKAKINFDELINTRYSVPGSLETISGSDLLDIYTQLTSEESTSTKILKNHKVKTNKTRKESFEKFRNTLDEFFLSREDEFNIFAAFDFNPVLIFKALTYLKGQTLVNASIEEFIVKFPGLDLPNAKEYYQGRYKLFFGDTYSPRKKMIDTMRRVFNKEINYDLNEDTAAIFSELIIHMYREDIEKSPLEAKKLLEEEFKRLEEGRHNMSARSDEFVRQVFRHAEKRIERIIDFELPNLRVDPYTYQIEGIAALVDHQRFILADNTGLGKGFQMIGGCEWLLQNHQAKKAILVTDAGYRKDLESEILKFTYRQSSDICLIDPETIPLIQGQLLADGQDSSLEAAQEKLKLRIQDSKYIIIAYNTFASLDNDNSEIFSLIQECANDDAVVCADEGHYMDQPSSYRSLTMRKLDPKYLWLFTATLYQSDQRRLFNIFEFLEPAKFKSSYDFYQNYMESPEAILRLQLLLSQYAICRLYEEVTEAIDTSLPISVEDQLSIGLPKVPNPQKISPDKLGNFEISWEQAVVYKEMVEDFIGFARKFNQDAESKKLSKIKLEGINPFVKLSWLMKVLYEPQKLGLSPNQNHLDTINRIAASHLLKEEKILLWGENTSIVEAPIELPVMQNYGIRKMDGKVPANERHKHRIAFNSTPFNAKEPINILSCQFRAAGISSSYKGATASINMQPPRSHSESSQVDGRIRRVYGRDEAQLARQEVFYYSTLPVFPKGFLDTVEDPELRETLSRGTVGQVAYQRLEASAGLHKLITSGIGKIEKQQLNNKLLREILEMAGIKFKT